MSEAYQCDRCGELQTGRSDYAVLSGEHNGHYQYERTIEGREFKDLCEGCFSDFEDFMDGRELRSRIPFGGKEYTIEMEIDPEKANSSLSWMPSKYTVEAPEDTSTVLERQVELGARNY